MLDSVRFSTGTCLLMSIEGWTLVSPGCKGWVCCETGSSIATGHVTIIGAGLMFVKK